MNNNHAVQIQLFAHVSINERCWCQSDIVCESLTSCPSLPVSPKETMLCDTYARYSQQVLTVGPHVLEMFAWLT